MTLPTSTMFESGGPNTDGKLSSSAATKNGTGDNVDSLRLHVERINAEALTFREMCDGSAFIPAAELHTIRKIGSGSFAKVEICRYTPPDGDEQLVAVKRLTSSAAVDVARFASEANILRNLKHENIVGYIGVGSVDTTSLITHHVKTSCYLVQEYMDGGTLKQKIWRQAKQRRQVYSDCDAAHWGLQIAAGLAYLHGANPLVLHRDLKLENILLQNTGPDEKRPQYSARICDFGLAASLLDPQLKPRLTRPAGLSFSRHTNDFHEQMQRHVAEGALPKPGLLAASKTMDVCLSRLSARPSVQPGLSRRSVLRDAQSPKSPRSPKGEAASKVEEDLTEAHSHHEAYSLTGRAGSFLYMAPETVMCQPYNEKVDIFSLGVILYELFMRKPLAAVLMEVGAYDPDLVEMFAYKVAAGYRAPMPQEWPPRLRALISECWHQLPDRRPSAVEVGRRLRVLEADGVFRQDGAGTASTACCSIQ